MKRASINISLMGAAIVLFTLVACQKNNQESNPGGQGVPPGFATTPQPCNLGQPGCSSPYVMNQYPYGGFPGGYQMMWPNQVNLNAPGCGCPSGQVPFYNTSVQWGLGCGGMPPGYNNLWNWNMSPTGYNAWFGGGLTTGYSTQTNYAYTNPAAASVCGGAPVYRYCDARFPTSCEAGSICQPMAGGTGAGFCVRGY